MSSTDAVKDEEDDEEDAACEDERSSATGAGDEGLGVTDDETDGDLGVFGDTGGVQARSRFTIAERQGKSTGGEED